MENKNNNTCPEIDSIPTAKCSEFPFQYSESFEFYPKSKVVVDNLGNYIGLYSKEDESTLKITKVPNVNLESICKETGKAVFKEEKTPWTSDIVSFMNIGKDVLKKLLNEEQKETSQTRDKKSTQSTKEDSGQKHDRV